MFFTREVKYSLLLLLLPLGLLGCSEQTEPDKRPVQSVHVDTTTLAYSTLRLSTELPGRIIAFKEAEVRPQITGIVKSRLYEEGSHVEAGQVLFQIDDTSYQSSVNSAKAQLKKALASETSTRKEAQRYAELLKKKLSSQQLYDQAESDYLQAKAEVALRQAELDNANIQLSYTQIKAPISGQAGFSEVSEGSLLTASQSTFLTTIIQSDNVYVDMQQSALSLYKLQQEFKNSATEKAIVPVSITLEDGTLYEHKGQLAFMSNQTDGSTGTVTLRAIFPNPEHSLLAGMYVRSHVYMPEARDYLVVPQSSVVRSQSGVPSVFIVDENNKTVKKSIELGNEVGNTWVVKAGLNVDDKVVLNNLNKMKNDLTVIIDSETQSATSASLENIINDTQKATLTTAINSDAINAISTAKDLD